MCPGAEVGAEPEGAVTVVLVGELDLARVEDVADLLTTALRRSACIRVDLAQVSFISCVVLGALVQAGCRARAAGGWVRISGCHPLVRRVLTLTQLHEAFGLSP